MVVARYFAGRLKFPAKPHEQAPSLCAFAKLIHGIKVAVAGNYGRTITGN